MRRPLKTTLTAAAAAAALALSGCAAGGGETADTGDQADLTFALVRGWDEGVAVAVLWQAILEDRDYDVELEYVDVAPAFAGVASGDYDVYLDAWLPNTHADYIDEYGDSMEELGTWNSDGVNAIAVNADAPIDSIEELADNADVFGNRLIGIEAGAGLTQMTEEAVIPQYGLDGMEYILSSTPAMLTELDTAMAAGEDIVVTLWQPHWAYDEYDLKNLEDPKGALGDAESMTGFAREGFSEDAPAAAAWLSDFEIDLETLTSLQGALVVGNDSDDYDERIEAWIADNREWVDSLTS